MHQSDKEIDTFAHGANEVRNWVNRPVAARCQNVSERNVPPRPLNAFMLYRKAYAIHLETRTTKPNQKMVSISAGRRWRQESVEVRNFYHDLAQLEQEQHALAFPSYRYMPRKRGLCQHDRHLTTLARRDAEIATSPRQTCLAVDAHCHDPSNNNGSDEDQILYLEVLQWLADDVTYEE